MERSRAKPSPFLSHSPADAIQAIHWRGRCVKCGGPPVIRIRSFMLHNDFVKAFPDLAAAIAASNPAGPFVPTTGDKFVHGPMVRLGQALYCAHHRLEGEQIAAGLERRFKTSVLVEIDRGPAKAQPFTQVAR